MLQKRAPSILDDVALPSMRRTQKEKHDATSSHSADIRYKPEPLTAEELDFFLSLDFEADDNDTGIVTGETRASFSLNTLLVENSSANGLLDSSSTLQSSTSSLSMATAASAFGYHPNQSFSTLNTSISSNSTHTSTCRDEVVNQVKSQKLKLISTMRRSAKSREAVQRMVHTFPSPPRPNATFEINTSATYCNRHASHPPGTGMNTMETKRKHEALSTEKEEAGLKEVRNHSIFDFHV